MSIFRGVVGMTTYSPPLMNHYFPGQFRSVSSKYSKGKIGPWQTEMCDLWNSSSLMIPKICPEGQRRRKLHFALGEFHVFPPFPMDSPLFWSRPPKKNLPILRVCFLPRRCLSESQGISCSWLAPCTTPTFSFVVCNIRKKPWAHSFTTLPWCLDFLASWSWYSSWKKPEGFKRVKTKNMVV